MINDTCTTIREQDGATLYIMEATGEGERQRMVVLAYSAHGLLMRVEPGMGGKYYTRHYGHLLPVPAPDDLWEIEQKAHALVKFYNCDW